MGYTVETLPSTACVDWADRLVNKQSIIPPPLYPKRAKSALDVFKELRIVDLPGRPKIGDVCAPWVFDFVASIFGAYDEQTGKQMIREVFLMIPKKNTKSTIAAAVMLTAQLLNWRESATFSIIAPTKEIAKNAFNPARDMCRVDEDLNDIMHVQEHIKTIRHRTDFSELKVLAAESDTVGGTKDTVILVDELHLFGPVEKSASMFTEATGGLASRPEGFVMWLTTQSAEPPAGFYKEKLEYARGVRDGKIHDPQFLPVIYEYPEEFIKSNEYLNPKYFYIVNPNLNYSVSNDFLVRELTKAQSSGEEAVRRFAAKHLNFEVGLSLRSDRWAGADYWEEATGTHSTVDEIIEKCEVIDVGIDGGGLDDLLGFNVLGRVKNSDVWLSWSYAWANPKVIIKYKAEAERFRDFERAGELGIFDDVGRDHKELVEICVKIHNAGLLDKIGVDPHGLGSIVEDLQNGGIPEDSIIGISQGWKLNGAIKTTERALASKKLQPANQSIMRWCVGNAKVEPRGNAVTITKQASGFAKIDPLMALFNSVTLLSLNPESKSGLDSFLFNPLRLGRK